MKFLSFAGAYLLGLVIDIIGHSDLKIYMNLATIEDSDPHAL